MAAGQTRANGFAGCNSFTAGYTLTADRLQFGPVATTRVFCAGHMELEARYLAALEATRSHRLSGSRLELIGEQDVVARFDAR
jgi:heat shock protein HslJ